MKTITSFAKKLFLSAACLVFAGGTVFAQNCLTSQLTISTGYDPATGTILSAGMQDPHWNITSLTPDCQAVAPATPVYAAYAVAPDPSWGTDPNSMWISFGNFATYATVGTGSYVFHVQRNFTNCQDDDYTFDFPKLTYDQNMKMWVDGVLYYTGTNGSQFGSFTSTSFAVTLSAGTHTIDVEVLNYAQYLSSNGHGLNFSGTITSGSGNNSLVSEAAGCEGYVCGQDDCPDDCFWKLTGNNIANGKNIFGTLTKDDVRIKTSGVNRGILTRDGLLGWNTMVPTAYLHVNCAGHNPDAGGSASDVRFERLETGKGNILVIDDRGYVYDSKVPLSQLGGRPAPETEDMQREIAELKARVAELSRMVNAKTDMPATADGNVLYQNSPNPFNRETAIDYTIGHMSSNAAIIVFDLNGRELNRFTITQKGKGRITIDAEKMAPGMYLYSLVVDGREVDTHKMIVAK